MLVFLVFQRNLCHCCSCFKTWVISKIILLFSTLSGSGPSSLSDLLLFYEHFRALRSSDRRLLSFIYHAAHFFLVCYFNVCVCLFYLTFNLFTIFIAPFVFSIYIILNLFLVSLLCLLFLFHLQCFCMMSECLMSGCGSGDGGLMRGCSEGDVCVFFSASVIRGLHYRAGFSLIQVTTGLTPVLL